MLRAEKNSAFIWACQLFIIVATLAVWEIAGNVSPKIVFFLGTPSRVAEEFWTLVSQEALHWHFFITGTEAIVGLLLGSSVGFALGLSLWFSERAANIFRPFAIVLGSLPIIAFAPLMIVWFGIGVEMKIVLAALSTLFIAFNQAYRGVSVVGEKYVEVLRGIRASNQKIFFKVVVPGSMDWLLSSMRLNIGFALLGAFIGEFIASDQGLGHLILRASALYNVARALAAAIGIVILALVLDMVGAIIERHRHALVQYISVPRLAWRKQRRSANTHQ